MAENNKIKVAISSCLLGESVRYNGGHKRSSFCADTLTDFFEFVPLCPEVGIGLGVPRESIRLQGDFDQPRAIGTRTEGLDVTEDLTQYADKVEHEVDPCCGYIFMKDSPSCGLFSTKVYTEKGVHIKKRAGLYAARIRALFPLMPMEESGRLNDSVLRENFIARVYLYADWVQTVVKQPQPKILVAFHSRHKYLIMAYSQSLYRELGRLVADAGKGDFEALIEAYISQLMEGTKKAPTRKGHANVLFHLVGYLREHVPGGIRQDLGDAVEEYRLGLVPLAVPMKLMSHYLDNYASDYIRQQSYLQPYPSALKLRNGV